MSYTKVAVWILLAGLALAIPLSGSTLNDQQEKPTTKHMGSQVKESGPDIPIYRPPKRGAPALRVGGSSRGEGCSRGGGEGPSLSVLAPDHIGLTVQEQPSLYWFLSAATGCPIEVTLTDDQTIHPLIEARLPAPIQPGVQRIQLADYGVRLAVGVPYRWYVALILDPENRSKDIIAGGAIERVALPEALRVRLAGAGKTQMPHLYAEAGLWYDALTSISELIDATPTDPLLRQRRAALLDQVALPDIAAEDRRHGRAP